MIVKCDNCKKEFNKFLSAIKKSKNNFCSNKCAGEFKRLDLVGKRFGEIDVIEFNCIKNGRVYYKCKCSCERVIFVRSSHLKKGQKTCNNCKSRKYKGKISGNFFAHAKYNALNRRSKTIKFDISKEFLWDLYQKQNGKCVYTGLDIYFSDTSKQFREVTTSSLDRIDSDDFYHEKNVQFIHKDINFLKNKYSENLFFYYIKNIIEFDKKFTRLENYKPDLSSLKQTWRFKGFGEISGNYWASVKKNAKSGSILFDLKKEDVWEKYLDQGGLCYWSGLPIKFAPNHKSNNLLQTASIDRVDSCGSYQIDNIVICHKHINLMKKDFTQEKFLYYCQLIYDYCNLKYHHFTEPPSQ